MAKMLKISTKQAFYGAIDVSALRSFVITNSSIKLYLANNLTSQEPVVITFVGEDAKDTLKEAREVLSLLNNHIEYIS